MIGLECFHFLTSKSSVVSARMIISLGKFLEVELLLEGLRNSKAFKTCYPFPLVSY